MKKKRRHNNNPVEDKDTSMVSKENECPYCDFQCKRASALKFHIDLKHKGEKKSVEKRKAEEHVDSTQKKKSKLVEITVDSPGKDTVNDRRRKKLQVKKLDDKASKATNKTPEPDERKENIQKFKGRSSKKHDDEIDQPERVFIINKKGMQETPKKKVPTIQKKAQKTSTENRNVAKNGKEYECQKFSKAKMNGEKVFLEEGANEEDENIEEDNDTTDDDDDDDGDEDDDCVEKTSDIDSDAENVSYICPVCSREFRLLHAVKQHIKARHPSQEIRNCDIISLIPKLVNKTTKSKVIANEKESKSSVKTIPSSTRKVICPFCKLSADHMVDIRAHIEAVHKNKDIQDVCNKTGNVLEHGVSKENVEIKMQNKTSTSVLHKCPFCNLGFMLKHEFTAHVRNAHGNKHDMLQSCDKEQAPGVGSHKIPEEKGTSAHRQLKSQVCSSDAKAKKKDGNKSTEPEETNVTIIKLYADKNGDFKDVSALGDDHKQNEVDSIETDAKPERRRLGKVKNYCDVCKKQFNSYQAFWSHNMQVHQVHGRPHKCGTCEKTFVFQHEKINHEKTHVEGRLMFCCDQEDCDSMYGERKALYRHLKLKHGEADPAVRFGTKKEKKRYECVECNIRFKNPSSHWRHELRFHKETTKKHECKICSKSFLFAHELKDHMFVHIHAADIQCPAQGCCFKTKKLKYLSNHLRLQHGQRVDVKTLGQQVLSGYQISAGELLELFNSPKDVKEEPTIKDNSPETDEVRTLEAIETMAEYEPGEPVEPDKQIKMLVGSDDNTVEDSSDSKIGGTVTTSDDLEARKQDKNNEHTDTQGNLPEMPVMPVTNNIPPESAATEDLVQDLEETESPTGVYRCQTCSEAFQTHRQLIKHMAHEHPDILTMFKCDDCDKIYFTEYDLRNHRSYCHQDDRVHSCEECGKSFMVLSALHRHMARHREKPDVVNNSVPCETTCDLCGITLRFKTALKQHMMKVHPETINCSCKICTSTNISKVVNETLRDKLPFCSMCNSYFCKKPMYECHMRVVHNTTGRHGCKFCPEKFSSLSQRNFHMHQVHTAPPEPEATESTDVGQVSTLNDDTHVIEINNEDQSGPKFLPKLSEHGLKAVTKELKIYSEDGGEKQWKCLLCAQSFTKVKYFNLHVRRTHVLPEHQPYRCKICSAGFVRVGEFRKHTRSHSGFRPLKCRTCFKSFKQQAHLRDHMLTHSDIRKYKCELCQGRYKQRGALLAHVVKHDKLRPFKCHFCGVGYTVRGALSKHMKKYIGKQDSEGHLCHICHKSFSHYPMLLRHIHIHQAPKPFICDTCNEAYACYTSLYFHKQKEKHFKPEEYETEPKRKYMRKAVEMNNKVTSEVTNAVTSMQKEEGYSEEKSNGVDVNTVVVRKDDGSENPETVEIIVQSSGAQGTTAFEVETHTDEELLSIAKQLTEMSTYPGHDSQTDREEERRIEEEEKIMMTMLDADDDVKVNLERHLMLSRVDHERNERESGTKVENTYVQILQYVDENGVTIQNVDESGLPVEHVVETQVPVSICENTVHIPHVDGAQGECTVPIQYIDENGVTIQQFYVDEQGNPIEEGIPVNISSDTASQSVSELKIQNVNESENVVSQTSQSDNDDAIKFHGVEDKSSLRILDLNSDKVPDASEVETSTSNDNGNGKEYGNHVVIAEGKIVEQSGFSSEKNETATNNGQSNETTFLGSINASSNVQVSGESQNGLQNNQMESINHEESEPDKQTFVIRYEEKQVLTEGYTDTFNMAETAEGESVEVHNAAIVDEQKSVMYSSQLAKALTEDNFNVRYSQLKRNMRAKAASMNESKGNPSSDSACTENKPPIKDNSNIDIQGNVFPVVENDTAKEQEKQLMLQSYGETQDASSVSGSVVSCTLSSVEAHLENQTILTEANEATNDNATSNLQTMEIEELKQQNVNQEYVEVQEMASSSVDNIEGRLLEKPVINLQSEQFQVDASSTVEDKVPLHNQLTEPQSYEGIQEFASTVVENADMVLKDLPATEQFYDSQAVSDVNLDQNQSEVVENINLNDLTLMDMTDFTPPPESGGSALLFKKADGSYVYICVGEEEARNFIVSESSKEVQSTSSYREEPDTRDNPTLEAAENLQSLAGSSLLELSSHKNPIHNTEFIELDGNLETAEISAGHPLFETVNNGTHQNAYQAVSNNPEMARKLIKEDGSSAYCIVYECPLCNIILKTKKNFRDHLKRHGKMEDRQFGCQQCPKRFVTRTELERHMRIHSNEKPCVCNVCGKRFRQPGHLVSHKRLHTGEKPYQCQQCGASFTTNSLLKTHYLVHTDERNFECTRCDLKFKALKDLRRHSAVHSKIVNSMKKRWSKADQDTDSENKFVCHKCGKTFSNKYTLKTHLEREENLRKYKCDVCSFASNSKAGLQVHLLTHKTTDLHVCKHCGNSFKREEYLKNHMKAKHQDQGQSLFPCPACNKQFNHRGALYYHIGVSPECRAKGETDLGSNAYEILSKPDDVKSINENKEHESDNDEFEQIAIYNVEINDDYDSENSTESIHVGTHSNPNAKLTVIQNEGLDVEEENSEGVDEESSKTCSKIIVIAKTEK